MGHTTYEHFVECRVGGRCWRRWPNGRRAWNGWAAIGKALKDEELQLEPGRYEFDEVVTLHVSGSVRKETDTLCSPAVSIRLTTEREMAALGAIDLIEKGETVEYQVIPL